MIYNNLLEKIPSDKSQEIFETIIDKDIIKIERILSQGQVMPSDKWYKQEDDEFVVLISGSAIIMFEDLTKVNLKTGDYLYIPALTQHRVVHTDTPVTTICLAIFLRNMIRRKYYGIVLY